MSCSNKFSFAFIVSLVCAISAAQTYSFVDLGTTLGFGSEALGINTAGIVVGYQIDSSGFEHPTYWINGMPQLLPDGGTYGQANAINSSNLIVGETGNGAALWQGGNLTQLPALSGTNADATAVNDAGLIAGDSANSSTAYQASGYLQTIVTWLNGAITDTEQPNNPNHTYVWEYAFGVDATGNVYGSESGSFPAKPQGLIASGSSVLALPDYNLIAAANRQGDFAGMLASPSTAFADVAGVVHHVDPYGSSVAVGINSSDVVIGNGLNATGHRDPFLWTATTGYKDLVPLIDPATLPTGIADGTDAFQVTGISNTGRIVGWAQIAGVQQAIELTPTPEPAPILALGLGLAALAFRRRK